MIAAESNRGLLDEYIAIEDSIDHTFRHKLSIKSIREALDAGERGEVDSHSDAPCGAWNM